MRGPVRPHLRAAWDSARGFRRPRARILLILSLVLTVWIVAFARLRRTTFSVSESGHTNSVEQRERLAERLAGFKAAHGFANPRVSHDTPAVFTELNSPGTPPLPLDSPSSDAVTFVLVATMIPDSAPRIANLLASMRTFLDPETPKQVVAELVVLVPDSELDWWLLAASALGDDTPWGTTRVVAESEVLPTSIDSLRKAAPGAARRELRGLGYRVQMLLKLAASTLVYTEFYVTLDCDVVLSGALKQGDLVRNNRGLVQGAMGGVHAKRWLSHSLDALFGETPGSAKNAAAGTSGNGADIDQAMVSRIKSCGKDTTLEGVGVTPAVLSASVARSALDWVSSFDSAANWDSRLFRMLDTGLDWTEYGIYAAWACVSGVFDHVHEFDPKMQLYDAKLQEDGSKFSDLETMRDAFQSNGDNINRKRSLFVVVQSIGGSDPRGAASAVKPYVLPQT